MVCNFRDDNFNGPAPIHTTADGDTLNTRQYGGSGDDVAHELIILNDGRTESRWDCDPGFLQTNKLHHLVVIVDGGPKIISFIVDGVFCDGQDFRQFGWGVLIRTIAGLRVVNTCM